MRGVRRFAAVILVSFIGLTTAWSQQIDPPIVLRISVENTESHVQTRAVGRFAALLAFRLGPAVQVRFSHSARRFRDSEVVAAIARGDLEMAVPGTWQLDRFVPEIGYLLLPDFYGATEGVSQDFLESAVGRDLTERIEATLGVTVPGLWMDLGAAHVFTTNRPIRSTEDFRGLRIRVAGGVGNELRVEALGADGIVIPFPDLPPRLADGAVDGVLTTFETVRSAQLWEFGIRYAYTDREYFPQYVPLVSAGFWRRLTPDQQQVFTDTWNEVARSQQIEAREAQREARMICEENGIEVFEPDPSELERARLILSESRDQIVRALGIDRQFLMRAASQE